MKVVKKILFIVIEIILLFITFGIIYTLVFVEPPLIVAPEHVYQIRLWEISLGLVLALVLALVSNGLLIYNEFKDTFNKKSIYFLMFISGFIFLIVQWTLLYSKEQAPTSWVFYRFYIDYFGIYKAYVSSRASSLFFGSIFVSVFYALSLLLICVIIWKGRKESKN